MEGTLKVTPEELKKQSTVAKFHLKTMNASLETIYSHMAGMKAYWTGSASDAHWQVYASLNSTIQTMLNSYAEHVKDLEVMAGVYDAAEETATEQAESMPASTLQ